MNYSHLLQQPIDYSASFTKAVADLAGAVRARCPGAVSHSDDMNYSAAQVITLQEPNVNDVQYRAYISSRGPVFALIHFERRGGAWHGLGSAGGQHPASCFREALKERGLHEVAPGDWVTPVPNTARDIDGRPATQFDVLFAEIV